MNVVSPQIATADGPSSTRAGPLPRHHYQQQPHLRWSPRREADHHRCEKSLRNTMKEMPSMGFKTEQIFYKKKSWKKKQSGCLNYVCTCTHVMIKHLLSPPRWLIWYLNEQFIFFVVFFVVFGFHYNIIIFMPIITLGVHTVHVIF